MKKKVFILGANEGGSAWIDLWKFMSNVTDAEWIPFYQYNDQTYRASRSIFGRVMHRVRTYLFFPIKFLWHARKLSKKSELLIVSSSPFFLPMLAAKMINTNSTKLITLMLDIYPEALVTKGLIKRNSLSEKIIKRWYEKSFIKMEAVVFVTQEHRDFVSQDISLPKNSTVIPVPGHTDLFTDPNLQAVGSSVNILYCGTLGLMHDTKSFLTWLNNERVKPNVSFSFYTSGAAKESFEAQISNLKSKKIFKTKITCGNSLNQKDWVEIMDGAEVGLVFQDSGAGRVIFPSKVASMLGAGQAILAVTDPDSELGRLITEYNCGWVIAENDIDGFDRSLSEMLNCDLLLTKRCNAFALGHEKFGRDAVSKKWSKFIK